MARKENNVVHARAYVRGWIGRNGARYSYRHHGLVVGGKRVNSPVERIWLDAGEAGCKVWGGRNGIEAAYSEWLTDQEERVRSDIADQLKFRPEIGDDELRRWVRALKADADEVDVAVWRHWIWQVKRKLRGLSVDLHLMPVVVGKQEAGKSTALRKLLGPVGDLVDTPSLAAVTDDRETFRLSRFAVMFFDEMEGAARADMEKLKNRITAETVAWRRLGKNEREEGLQRSTFLGATNKSVVELLVDPTGMRRFYEMEVDDRLDWEAINTVNYLAVWQCVDEASPPPVAAVRAEVRLRQKELVADDPVTEWWEARCIDSGAWTPAKKLYEGYARWCIETGQKPVKLKVWGARMKKLVGNNGFKKSDAMQYRLRVRTDVELAQPATSHAPQIEVIAGRVANG